MNCRLRKTKWKPDLFCMRSAFVSLMQKHYMGYGVISLFYSNSNSILIKIDLLQDVKNLPEPVTLQCIQSDGKKYHFGVLQLNTLEMNGSEGVKNMWYSMPVMQMYESCSYVSAQPTLKGYNPQVIKYLKAFYNNQ